MSISSIDTPKWTIGPGWNLTSEESPVVGGSSESYYYYFNSKPKAASKPKTEEADVKSALKIDWSQKALDSYNFGASINRVLREAQRVGVLKPAEKAP